MPSAWVSVIDIFFGFLKKKEKNNYWTTLITSLPNGRV